MRRVGGDICEHNHPPDGSGQGAHYTFSAGIAEVGGGPSAMNDESEKKGRRVGGGRYIIRLAANSPSLSPILYFVPSILLIRTREIYFHFALPTTQHADHAQVRMQLYGALNPGKPVPGFVSILSSLVKNDGVGSIYKGVDAAVGRQLVYGTARIGLHRYISDKMVEMNEGRSINFGMKALSGMASGSIAVCIGTPFDIALVRLQSDSMAPVGERKNYKNVFDALTRTVKEEGVGALYKGLAPNILRGMSMNVGMMACYDQAKEVVGKLLGDPMTNGPGLTTQIGASAVAVSPVSSHLDENFWSWAR